MYSVFWLSIVFILYTYILYPLLIFILSKNKIKTHCSQNTALTAAVVIVVHNEAHQIEKKINNIQAQDANLAIKQIIIVSDASTDQTDVIVKALQKKDPRIEGYVLSQQSGKAAGINLGMSKVNADIVVFADARQEFETTAISNLLCGFADESVAAVAGELRFREPGEAAHVAQSIGLYWKYETWIRACESDFYSLTGAPGAIYAIRRDYFVPLPEPLILDDVWIPMHIVLAKKRVIYCPSAIAWDYSQEKSDKEFKRKVRTLAGNIEFVALQPKAILPSANPFWWMFVSHKLFRMVVPYAFMLALLSNVFILDSFYAGVLFLQVGFYFLGYLGSLNEAQHAKKSTCKLCTVIYVFLMMNQAAVYGLVFYLKGKHNKLWNA